jgi:enamine deaminase RidA (YjgF/YER057c/UK114 family)
MGEKKVDVSKIESVNLGSNMGEILYGQHGKPEQGLLDNIKDASKEAIQTCSQELNSCSDSLMTSIQQANTYINSIANAFKEMDDNIAKNIKIESINSHHKRSEAPNRYAGAF